MKIQSRLLLASALVLGAIGSQAGAAFAEPRPAVDTRLATPGDARLDSVRYCNWRGCFYGHGYYHYGYRPYGYAYHPYAYRYVVPGVRFGFY